MIASVASKTAMARCHFLRCRLLVPAGSWAVKPLRIWAVASPALLGRLRQISVGEFLPGLGQEILAGLSMLLDSRRVGAAG